MSATDFSRYHALISNQLGSSWRRKLAILALDANREAADEATEQGASIISIMSQLDIDFRGL